MELALFELLSELDPVLDVVEVPRLVARVRPQPRRLVTTARLNEGVDN